VTALEASVDELLPNVGQVLDTSSEKIDSLSPSNLHVEIVLFGDLPECDELVGGDFAAGNSGDDWIEATPLNIGQESVVGILECRVLLLEYEVVVHAGEDRCDRWFANLAAVAKPVFFDKWIEGRNPFDGDDFEELLARVREMLAQPWLGGFAGRLQLCIQDVGHER
jgi:hypothetical protein